LSYYFQAAALDSSLAEAVSRSSVMAANISSGNIGVDARNDIQWRRDWIARLTETEQFFDNFLKNERMPYTFYYTTGIQREAINYQNETIVLTIEASLNPNDIWPFPLQDALVAVYDGLTRTGRKSDWGLAQWPYQRVTNLNPFVRRSSDFSVVIELVNNNDKVIGSQTFQAGGWWEFQLRNSRNEIFSPVVDVSDVTVKNVSFTVKVDDITDNLTIRVVSVNGQTAETVARNGLLQVMSVSSIPRHIRIPNSVNSIKVREFENKQLTSVTIPSGVTSIGERAFSDNQLASVIIPSGVTFIGEGAFSGNQLASVIIPSGITSIGDMAFQGNQLTSVTIPGSVTSIGDMAFQGNQLTSVTIPGSVTSIQLNAFRFNPLASITIGANVKLGNMVFNDSFDRFYNEQGKKAGTYVLRGGSWSLQ